MKITVVSVLLGAICLMAGCITINIYFPASAAEKAADKIIDEVWQAQGQGNATRPLDNSEKP